MIHQKIRPCLLLAFWLLSNGRLLLRQNFRPFVRLLYALPFFLLEFHELVSGTPCNRKVSYSVVEGIEHTLDRWGSLSLYLIEVLIREVVVLVECAVVQASGEHRSLPGVIPIVCLRHFFEMAY